MTIIYAYYFLLHALTYGCKNTPEPRKNLKIVKEAQTPIRIVPDRAVVHCPNRNGSARTVIADGCVKIRKHLLRVKRTSNCIQDLVVDSLKKRNYY